MQKKKLNKILIVAVALIWGVVIYKFAAPYFLSEDVVITADALVGKPQILLRKKDTFKLSIPDRDPFLGKSLKVRKKTVAVSSVPKKKVSRPKVNISNNWPRVEYLGYIKSKQSISRLGLLRLDGVLKRVRRGAEVKGIRVKDISEDKISLQLGKDIREFNKQN